MSNIYLKPQSKNAIKVLGTTGAVGYYVYTQYRKGKGNVDVKMLIVWSVIIAVLVFVVLQFTLKQIPSAERPKDIDLGADDSNGGVKNFDPVPLVNALHEDVTEYFGVRNVDVYRNLLNLSNTELRACYNYWTKKYFDADGETMTQAIAGEMSSWFDTDFRTLRDQLVSRLKTNGGN